MSSLSLLIKPASSACNQACRYCFYHDIAEKRETECFGMMSEETLEIIVRRALSEATGECTFAFQGGEPTLVGLDFYRRLIALEETYRRPDCRVINVLQTNGTLIDEEWASFLSEHGFFVGISLDGPPEIHDLNRIDAKGEGTHSRVCHAIRLLSRHGVNFNVLSVLTSRSARHPDALYRYFKRLGVTHLQFIPCLDPYGGESGEESYSLSPRLYGEFLKKLFDLWYVDLAHRKAPRIRYFDNLLAMAAGAEPESCGMSGACRCQLVIESDASVYPCDFYAFDFCRLGNVRDDSFSDILRRDATRHFLLSSSAVDPECRGCRWYPLCRGGCRRDRDRGDGLLGKNYYCEAYRAFFEYAAERLSMLASRIDRR